jgi:tRNA threonylcarbamoyladenosine biosynthesis protein TsaB
LCFALDKPLIAIETLEAMTFGVLHNDTRPIDEDGLLCPMIDARRMEVFTAVFTTSYLKIKPTAAEIIDAESFATLLETNRILFFGDGADKCRDILGANPNAFFLPDFTNSATYLTQKALEKFRNNDFVDVAYFEPYYLKDFVAGKKAV